jgi:hypothetical protein
MSEIAATMPRFFYAVLSEQPDSLVAACLYAEPIGLN